MIIVPVPAVEPVVSSWRERFDSSARQGLPAHITLLAPFLTEDRVTDAVVDELRALCADIDRPDLSFPRVGRFPGVRWLDPEPADGLRDLTSTIAGRWPEAPPYGGQFDEVIPHLTVACGDDDTLDAVTADLTPRLPLRATPTTAQVYVFDGTTWRLRADLPFRDPPPRLIAVGRPGSLSQGKPRPRRDPSHGRDPNHGRDPSPGGAAVPMRRRGRSFHATWQ